MAAPQDQPLDEIQWRSPAYLYSINGLHSNSVLPYFSASPYFDPTSNNATVTNQAMHNPNMYHLIETREAFEGRLRSMNGLEFMVAQEPAEMAPGTGTGVWVIRKQIRRKRPGQEDELTVLATYFVVGENIYMAPAVGDVIGSRLLTIASCLKNFISTASGLTEFSPALGNTYLPPTVSKPKADSQLGQASKEVTPMPGAVSDPTAKKSQNTLTNSFLTSRLLDDSFNLTMRYSEEYMDENPITGQPGEFHLSTTGRTDKDRLAVPGKSGAAQPSATSTPDPKNAELPGAKKAVKPDKSPKPSNAPKIKRRKSNKIVPSAVANG